MKKMGITMLWCNTAKRLAGVTMKTVLFFLLFMLLTGCFGSSDAKPLHHDEIVYVNPSERTPQNLVMWHSMTAGNGLLLEELIREFNETIGNDQGITVDLIFQGSYADSSAQLRTFLNTNNISMLPDISQIDATGMIDIKNSPFLADAGIFATLDPNFNTELINLSMRNNITYTERLLGLPFAVSTNILFYNKNILEEAGFNAAPSTLQDMAQILTRLSGGDILGFALSPATPTVQNWIGQQSGLSFVVNNQNGRGGLPTHVVFNEGNTMYTFLQEWKNLYKTGGLRHIEANTLEEFVAGRIAMMVGSSSNIAAVTNAVDGRFALGASFFPRVNENAVYGSTLGGSSLFMFNKGDLDRMWAAWEVKKFLTSPEIQARWSMGTGYLAANYQTLERREYVEFLQNNPLFAVAMKQLEISNPNLQGIWVPSSFQFFMELRNGIISMIEDDKTPAQTARDLEAALNRILDDFHEANR